LAEKLGYDANTTLEFKGHSLRRTAATILADQGASGQTLRNKLNHSSEKTVSEYISSSKKVQATNASLLGNVTIENQEPKPEAKKQKMEETQR
jgi:integrase